MLSLKLFWCLLSCILSKYKLEGIRYVVKGKVIVCLLVIICWLFIGKVVIFWLLIVYILVMIVLVFFNWKESVIWLDVGFGYSLKLNWLSKFCVLVVFFCWNIVVNVFGVFKIRVVLWLVFVGLIEFFVLFF